MAYTALYRKFRPQNFTDVKGQDPISKTLVNQIKSDRVGHAYLFCGTRGTGKTSVAKIFARAINCLNPVDGSPCNECEVCKGILNGTSMNVVEIDAASNNSVDNIRQIVEEVKYSPTEGRYKVYIIDEVHMMTPSAFNALLKTLEEPPSYVVFILATTEAHKIPITILSRCQRYDFKRIPLETITARLEDLCKAEGINADEEALRYVAKCGDGSLRDSLSLLDRCAAFYFEESITYDKVLKLLGTTDVETFAVLLRAISGGNVYITMGIIDDQVAEGRDLSRFIVDFTWYMRNLLLAKNGKALGELLEVTSEQLKLMQEEAMVFDEAELIRYINVCSELTNRIRFATQKRVLIETELIRLCKPQMDVSEDAFADRIRKMEKELEELKVHGVVTVSEEEVPAAPVVSELPKALPEDISKIINIWPKLAKETEFPLSASLTVSRPCIAKNGSDGLFILVESTIDEDRINKGMDNFKETVARLCGVQLENVEVRLNNPESQKQEMFDLSFLVANGVEIETI